MVGRGMSSIGEEILGLFIRLVHSLDKYRGR